MIEINNKLEWFYDMAIWHQKTDSDFLKAYLFVYKKDLNKWGILDVSLNDDSDNHCEQCMSEFLVFGFGSLENDSYPMLSATCSEHKMNLILFNKLKEFSDKYILIGNLIEEKEKCFEKLKELYNEE